MLQGLSLHFIENHFIPITSVISFFLRNLHSGNLSVVQLLIWKHANINQVDHEGRTCLSYAKAALSLTSTHLRSNLGISDMNETLPFDSREMLVEMLENLGCSDPLPSINTSTLPRKRDTLLRPSVFT